MKHKSRYDAHAARLQINFLALVIGIITCAFILAGFYQFFFKPDIVDPLLLLPQHRVGLSPKPVERFVFLALAFMATITAYWMTISHSNGYIPRKSIFFRALIWLSPIITAFIFFIPFVGFDFSQALLSGKSIPPEHPVRFLFLCLLFAAVRYRYLWMSGRQAISGGSTSIIAWTIFLSSASLQIVAWRIHNEGSITVNTVWSVSMDAVLYSLSQVIGGKTLLVDLPAQYGLYGEFVGPIFRAIGFSFLKYTLFFAFLQLVSLSAIFYVMQKIVHDAVLRLTFGVALVMITFETSLWLIGIPEMYYQYWPIRFFWPAISVLAFFIYVNKQSGIFSAAVSVVGAIGSLWNADSGLMIEVAFATFLLAKWTFLYMRCPYSSLKVRAHLKSALIAHIFIFAVLVTAMLTYMAAKANHPLHLPWLVEYQRLFYGLGFMMLPIPLTPHPWMAVVGVYLIGMMSAVAMWHQSPMAKKADLIFFVSALGLGLFMYYQGRSHILNLISVCWPALLLVGILVDHMSRHARARSLSGANLCIPTVALAIILFCCIPFVKNIGGLWNDSSSRYVTRNTPSDPLISGELAFLRAYSLPGTECVILSKRNGIYHALTGTASPLTGPGYAELLTMKDRAALIGQLRNKRFACLFVGVGENSEFELGIDPLSILQGYSVVATSISGSMLYLRPRD